LPKQKNAGKLITAKPEERTLLMKYKKRHTNRTLGAFLCISGFMGCFGCTAAAGKCQLSAKRGH
tara:strand:+ start:41 stop:232 length:192 start_codon:yes stop_codon:yes gene_type:complete